MKVPVEDFGDAGIVRRLCDNTQCAKPITLRWTRGAGEYCSNQCLKDIEGVEFKTGERDEMTETATATASESPIAAGDPTPAPKKRSAAKKAAPTAKPKAAAAPKPKAAKSAAGGRSLLDGDAKVKVSKDFDATVFKGKGKNIRYERAKRVKDGMTVQEYADVCAKNEACAGGGRGFLKFLEEKGMVKVS